MDPPAKRSRERRDSGGGGGIRPSLLAGGMALMWFVQFQGGLLPSDAPNWGMALVIAGRLAADFVGAAVLVAVARLGLAAARLALAHWRVQRPRGM
jgi:hypothetical protein